MGRQSSSAVAVGRSVRAVVERVGDADHLVADADARVPERVEQRLGDGADSLGRLGRQQADVEIALQPDDTAPVAADRREEDRRPPPLLLHGGEGGRVERREQAVHDLGVAAAERDARLALGARACATARPGAARDRP